MIFFNQDSSQFHQIEELVPHPNFKLSNLQNDIGLIKLKTSIVYNKFVRPVPLRTKLVPEGTRCLVHGWGRISTNGPYSKTLQSLDVVTINTNKCKQVHKEVSDRKHVCTLAGISQGVCHMDSGGPLVADGELIGIVSFGIPCGKGHPDVFTRVSSYLEWINWELNV